MRRKSVFHTVVEAYDEIMKLQPTPKEIQAYADMLEREDRHHNTVTYSISTKHGNPYFICFHDTWQQKRGGACHVDLGYIDQENKAKNDSRQYRDIADTTHLMLGRNHVIEFIEFIKKKRLKETFLSSHS